MDYLVMSDTYPGYWGADSSIPGAVAQWRSQGGRGRYALLVIHPYYHSPYVDVMGSVGATATDPNVPRRERPPVLLGASFSDGARVGNYPLVDLHTGAVLEQHAREEEQPLEDR